jgi:hypothetical protein
MKTIDITVFAHNERVGIAAMIAGLARQDILVRDDVDARVFILAHACTDDTLLRARRAVAALAVAHRFEVVDLPAAVTAGTKSGAWNAFVHRISRRRADALVLCDADIEIPDPDALSRLVGTLASRPRLAVASSQPVKDIVVRPEGLSRLDRLIAASGGGLDDWRKAICGQLYAIRATEARAIHLPIGLPVEDGFLRAMVLTRLLSGPEDMNRIDGAEGVHHVYASERGVGALVRHQTRLVIGGAINLAVFEYLRALPRGSIPRALAEAAKDEAWLARVVRQRLPMTYQGWVPVHFLTKRAARMLRGPAVLRPRWLAILVAGFGFDLVVYATAQAKMARGAGPGYWGFSLPIYHSFVSSDVLKVVGDIA